MHCAYWRLTHDPFQANSPDHAWFPSGDHDEALSRMLYVIERGHRCGMVWGPTGIGKSRLLREIRRQIPHLSTTIVSADLTGLNRSDFALALANACGAGLKPTTSSATAWTYLEDWVRGRAAVQGRVVWILDELDTAAESIEPDALRLARLAERSRTASTMILALQRPGLTVQLSSFADFIVELTPWSADESRAFVSHALDSVGGSTDIITDDAWDVLLDAAAGNPQRLMRITEVGLVAGCVMETSELTADLLTAVVHQLGWEVTEHRAMLTVD